MINDSASKIDLFRPLESIQPNQVSKKIKKDDRN